MEEDQKFRDIGVFSFKVFIDLFHDFKVSAISPLVIHAFDVAKIATAIYKRVGDPVDSFNMYLAGLFHDVGLVVYSQLTSPGGFLISVKESFVDGGNLSFDINRFLERFDGDLNHPKISYAIVKNLRILGENFLEAILHHHTSLKDLEGSDQKITLANILNVSDVIAQTVRKNMRWGEENSYRAFKEIIAKMEMVPEVRKAVEDLSNDMIEMRYCFDEDPYHDVFLNMDLKVDFLQMIELLKMLVLFIDLRSRFTLRHSSAIATLSRDLTVEMLKSEFDGMMMYAAGLIHDLGKIRVPLYILHKPDKLDEYEMYIMKLHVVDTFKILSKYNEFGEITAVASLHHERLDGSGYPWGWMGKYLGIRSRILQVVDVYEALLEDRPYRPALGPREALKIIESDVNRGKLDGEVFRKLKEMVKNGYEIKKEDLVVFEFFEDMKERTFGN